MENTRIIDQHNFLPNHRQTAVEEAEADCTQIKVIDESEAALSMLDERIEKAIIMFSRLVKQLAEKENVTEKLKAKNQMLWVQKMNNIRNRATEIVNTELIFAV